MLGHNLLHKFKIQCFKMIFAITFSNFIAGKCRSRSLSWTECSQTWLYHRMRSVLKLLKLAHRVFLKLTQSCTSSPDILTPLPQICSHTVPPPPLYPSSPPLPLIIPSHLPPSYIIILASHHMPISSQPPFLYILRDFSHFHCPSLLVGET